MRIREAKDGLSTAALSAAFHCAEAFRAGESGLRGKTDEGRRAEKLNAKLLGLWEGISPWSPPHSQII